MELLREHRIKKGLNFKQMADTLHISKTFYWQIENGQRKLTYGMAVKIAAVFHLKPDDLFYEEFKKEE